VEGWVLVAAGTNEGAAPLWVKGIDADGCVRFDDRDGEGSRDGTVLGVAGDPAFGYLAVGRLDETLDDGTWRARAWLRRYAPSGDIEWTRREVADGDLIASGVAFEPDGGMHVVGGAAVDWPVGARGWSQRYDADGFPRGPARWLGNAGVSHLLDVITDAGSAWVTMWLEDGSTTEGALARLDPQGVPTWIRAGGEGRLAAAPDGEVLWIHYSALDRWTADGAASAVGALGRPWGSRFERAAVNADGEWFVVGAQGNAAVLHRFDADGTWRAMQPMMRVDGNRDDVVASDISIAPDGALFIVGMTTRWDAESTCEAWLTKAYVE